MEMNYNNSISYIWFNSVWYCLCWISHFNRWISVVKSTILDLQSSIEHIGMIWHSQNSFSLLVVLVIN